MVELLVVISIIAMLAGMALAAMAKAREAGKLTATKATIAKLNDIVMRRYESYRTRRVPLYLAGQPPYKVAEIRMKAIRDLMRMEMPDRWADIKTDPQWLDSSNTIKLLRPSLSRVYQSKIGNSNPSDHQQAKCLYLWVMTACPEARGQFRPEEIADVDKDGWKCFVDGWGKPIGFLRWAPGATAWSDIQIDDTSGNNLHHDPFDPTFIQNGSNSQSPDPNKPSPYRTIPAAYQLYPLIFAGVLGKVKATNGNLVDDYGIALGNNISPEDGNVTAPTTDPFNFPYMPMPNTGPFKGIGSILPTGGVPLVHNHHMEAK